jgi:UPF0716 protein FxsA
MWRLVLLFTVVPALELALLLQIGAWLGPWQTFAIVVVTGTVGAWLAKREGFGVMRQLREELSEGIPPGSRIAEGVLVFAGGLLLVTPGVMTDIAGFLFIAPPTRRWLAPRVVRAITSRLDIAVMGPGGPIRPDAPSEDPFDPEAPQVRVRRPGVRRPAPERGDPFASPFDD